MRFVRTLCVVCIAVIVCTPASTQPSEYFLSVEHSSPPPQTDIEIRAELIRTGAIYEVFLFYRPYGRTEFTPVEMNVIGSVATGSIPASQANPPYVEYYLVAVTTDGIEHTYPVREPEYNPLTATIRPPALDDLTVVVLSPQRGERVHVDDLVISASFHRLPEAFDRQSVRIYLNDRELTSHAVLADDILLVVPSNIEDFQAAGGTNTIRLDFRPTGSDNTQSFGWDFNLVAPTAAPAVFVPPPAEFRYNVSMRGESRSETFGGGSTWYNRSTMRFSGEHRWLRVNSNLHVTNEERATRQPQNRYSISAETPWGSLHAGDTYPRFPSLIMNGRRLRGFFGQLELGWFNLDYATGQTIRRIEGSQLYTVPVDSVDEFGVPVTLPPNTALINDTTYGVFSYGTHTRTLTAVRPSFGRRDLAQLGFTYLHSKDDMGSIAYGHRPAENLLVGSDLRISLDRRRIEFVGQVAGSIQNNDISGGNLSRDELDDLLGSGTVDRLEDFVSLSTLQKFITINQYLVPFDPLQRSSLAVDTHVRLNYYGNNLQVGYIRRGNDYNSFGLSSIRRDVSGYRIRDRQRLMMNQLFLDFSLERLRDNLNDTKEHTTYFDRYDASVSWYPRRNLPSVTVGYGYFRNDNRVDPAAPEGAAAIRDVTNRFFTQLAHNFFWRVHHTGTLSFNMSFRDDQSGRNADIDIYHVMAMVNTRYGAELPLRTNVGIGVYHSVIPFFDPQIESFRGNNFDYYNLILGGEYRLFDNELILSASFIPTFGDYNRTVYQAGAQYFFMQNLSLVFQADYLVNPNIRNDVVSNLVLRYDL